MPDRTSNRARKATLIISAAMLWAALHYGVAGRALSQGLDRPLCLLVGEGGVLAALLVLILGAVTAGIVGKLDGWGADLPGLAATALALAAWAYPGGTMDDWLKNANVSAGPGSAGAYIALIPEYLCLALIFGAVFLAAGGRGVLIKHKTDVKDGITGLCIATAVATLLITLFAGPRVSHTYHGQVYFSTAAGFILATIAASKVSGVRTAAWYLPAPFLAGVIGLLYAAARPGLGSAYANINVIPVNGLVRGLPIETAAVGVAAILFTLRTANRLSSGSDSDA